MAGSADEMTIGAGADAGHEIADSHWWCSSAVLRAFVTAHVSRAPDSKRWSARLGVVVNAGMRDLSPISPPEADSSALWLVWLARRTPGRRRARFIGRKGIQ